MPHRESSPAAVVTSFGRCPFRRLVRIFSVISPACTAASSSDRSYSVKVTGAVSFV